MRFIFLRDYIAIEKEGNYMKAQHNLIYVDLDKFFEILERMRLIQFHIVNMKRQMKMGVFMCIDTDEEMFWNNELEKLAEGMN